MAIFYPDPYVFIGGAQPYAPKLSILPGWSVDNPPFGRYAPTPWQAPLAGFPQSFPPRLIQPGVAPSGDNPPPYSFARIFAGYAWYYLPDPQPQRLLLKFTPDGTITPDQPPQTSFVRIFAAYPAWYIPPPMPTLPTKFIPFTPLIIPQVPFLGGEVFVRNYVLTEMRKRLNYVRKPD